MNYVKELMKYIDVDSYGSCLHNRDFPSEGGGRHDMSGPERKTELLASYRFTLAFENTWTRDYVTEKFFQPLLAGSVPVVSRFLLLLECRLRLLAGDGSTECRGICTGSQFLY